MAEQGGGRASWREAFQPLRNGAAFVSPSVLYKLLAKASSISLATSEISPQEVCYRNIAPPPFLSHHNPSPRNSVVTLCCTSNFEAMWNQIGLVTLVSACACSEISVQYVDQRLLLAIFWVFRVLH
jgi:hypothetical protein